MNQMAVDLLFRQADGLGKLPGAHLLGAQAVDYLPADGLVYRHWPK